MGAVNIVSLAAAGYLAYANWDKPRWDRRVVVGKALPVLSPLVFMKLT